MWRPLGQCAGGDVALIRADLLAGSALVFLVSADPILTLMIRRPASRGGIVAERRLVVECIARLCPPPERAFFEVEREAHDLGRAKRNRILRDNSADLVAIPKCDGSCIIVILKVDGSYKRGWNMQTAK